MTNLGGANFATAAILLFLAIVFVILRCIARIGIMKSFCIDDWLMMLTLLFYIVYCIWVFYGTSYNHGAHTIDIPVQNFPPALMAFYFGEVFYAIGAVFLKMSIGAFLLRIVESRAQRYTIYGTLLVVGLFSVIFIFLTIFQCHPISHYWNLLSPGKCLNQNVILGMVYTQCVLISGSDFIFSGIPIFLVWNLQMSRFMKFSVGGLMSLGVFAGITTIIRIPYIIALASSDDFFYETAKLTIVTTIEPGLGIIIGSAAALRPLFKKLFKGSFFGSSRDKSTQKHASSSNRRWPASSNDTHHRLSSLKTDRSLKTSVMEDSQLKNGRAFCGIGDVFDRTASEEELAPVRNIYKETTVETTVEIIRLDSSDIIENGAGL